MKRFICIVMLAVMLPVIALAEYSSMTIDELVALREQLMLEIMNRPEWTETELDAGSYRIGKDIPSGVYRIVPKNTYVTLSVYDGSKLLNMYGIYGEEIGRLVLDNGDRLEIDATIILMPFTGI